MLLCFCSEPIKEYLERLHPSISHYRRAHAPNRRYLAPELSAKGLHRQYLEEGNPGCSYGTFRSVIRELNISFAPLGKEQCSACLLLNDQPEELAAHKTLYRDRRVEYKADVDQHAVPIYTLDLQKVLMLPR